MDNQALITDEHMAMFQGVIPAAIATVDQNGIPNVSYISQIYYVDSSHLAVSHQFFNKTARNIEANPKAQLIGIDPQTLHYWQFDVDFLRFDREGEIFDNMAMQLEAIASMSGMQDVFRLEAASIFRVVGVQRLTSQPSW